METEAWGQAIEAGRQFVAWATALPTLTWQDFDSGTPRIGGQLQLSVSSGILGGPVGDMLVLATAPAEALPLCAGGPILLVQPPWIVVAPLGISYDGLGGGNLPDIAIPRRGRLRGAAVYAQVFFAEAGARFCSLRSTQALQIVIR